AERRVDRALVAVPLIPQDRVIGAVVVTHETGRTPDADEVGLIQAFADYAALALENARLYSEATRRRHQAEELARVARLMTESLDISTVADRIAEAVLSLLRVPASVIRLREADGSLLVVGSAGRTRYPFEPGHRLPPGSGVAGQAIAEGRPVIGDPLAPALATRMTADFRLRIERSGIRTVLAVPLRVAETVLGVLSVGDEEGRAFSAADVALIQTFADQAAVALTNARFFQEGE